MKSLWPSETAGSGRILKPYLKERDGQVLGLNLRRVSCAQCGFPGCDLVKHDHSGGSLSGDGAMGAVPPQETGAGDLNQAYNSGGGCPLCGSKNFFSNGRRYDEFASTAVHEDRLA